MGLIGTAKAAVQVDRCSVGSDWVLTGLFWWNSWAVPFQVQCKLKVPLRWGLAAAFCSASPGRWLTWDCCPVWCSLSGTHCDFSPTVIAALCIWWNSTVLSLRDRTFKDNVLCVERILSQSYSFWFSQGGSGLTLASDSLSHPVVCWMCGDGEPWERGGWLPLCIWFICRPKTL